MDLPKFTSNKEKGGGGEGESLKGLERNNHSLKFL